jgi:hypothetical protein
LSAAEAGEVTPLNSLKGTLAKRREEIASELFLELEVPRWQDPTIVIRYQLVPHEIVSRAQRSLEKAKGNRGEAELNANKDLLIKACVGIVAKSPDDEWTGFGDETLAESLGVATPSARAVCGALFYSDGDIFSHASAVIEFCGYKNAEVETDLAGE